MSFLNAPRLPASHSLFPNPDQVIPKLHLFTRPTPNGQKVASLLEALREAYPEDERLAYDYTHIRTDLGEQKTLDFLEINPDGRIPALLDDQVLVLDGKAEKRAQEVFEGISLMLWLVERYDLEYKFWFEDGVERSTALSWIFFGHSGLGPMHGEANWFLSYAHEKIPYALKRYQDETKRLYTVLETHLATNGVYLVGAKHSVVDMSMAPWVGI